MVERPSVDELVAVAERSPDGPEVGAFFDFDGTLIHGFSALALQRACVAATSHRRRSRTHC